VKEPPLQWLAYNPIIKEKMMHLSLVPRQYQKAGNGAGDEARFTSDSRITSWIHHF
jgi:hypothetical protein